MGMLRVIGGTARGLRLKHVPGDTTRPITDKVKEALFNILLGEIPDVRMLDLFGGTGAVGIEALSHGAKEVTFLDTSRLAVNTNSAGPPCSPSKLDGCGSTSTCAPTGKYPSRRATTPEIAK